MEDRQKAVENIKERIPVSQNILTPDEVTTGETQILAPDKATWNKNKRIVSQQFKFRDIAPLVAPAPAPAPALDNELAIFVIGGLNSGLNGSLEDDRVERTGVDRIYEKFKSYLDRNESFKKENIFWISGEKQTAPSNTDSTFSFDIDVEELNRVFLSDVFEFEQSGNESTILTKDSEDSEEYHVVGITYNVLKNIKIHVQTFENKINNVYWDKIEGLTNGEQPDILNKILNGVGMKRYISQYIFNNYRRCKYFTLIDDSTCLLSDKNAIQDWGVAIDHFREDLSNGLSEDFIYGFTKITKNKSTEATRVIKRRNSCLFKFIFTDRLAMELNMYDPFCVQCKEDVDWCERSDRMVFWKHSTNNNVDREKITCYVNTKLFICKPYSANCQIVSLPTETRPGGRDFTKGKINPVVLQETTLKYYVNFMTRMRLLFRSKTAKLSAYKNGWFSDPKQHTRIGSDNDYCINPDRDQCAKEIANTDDCNFGVYTIAGNQIFEFYKNSLKKKVIDLTNLQTWDETVLRAAKAARGEAAREKAEKSSQAKAARDRPARDRAAPERRKDSDGKMYTLKEFTDYYGQDEEWNKAPRQCSANTKKINRCQQMTKDSSGLCHNHTNS